MDSNGFIYVEHIKIHLNAFVCIIYIDIDDIGCIYMEIYENSKYYENPCTMYAGEKCVLNGYQKIPRRPPRIESDIICVIMMDSNGSRNVEHNEKSFELI